MMSGYVNQLLNCHVRSAMMEIVLVFWKNRLMVSVETLSQEFAYKKWLMRGVLKNQQW